MKRDRQMTLSSSSSLISRALLGALSITALSVMELPSASAKVPPITIGARYGGQQAIDASETSPVRDWLSGGLTLEVELLRYRAKQREHFHVYAGWITQTHNSNFYNGELSVEREIMDVGVSYSYQLMKWVKPYALFGVGLAFDEVTLDYFSEPLIAERNGLFHANAQLGFEFTLMGNPKRLKRPRTSMGARLLYDVHYIAHDDVKLKLEDAPPNLVETTLGTPPGLSHGFSLAVFVQF